MYPKGLYLLLLLSLLTIAGFSQNVEISDTMFLQCLINEGVDQDGNGAISVPEAESVTNLYLEGEFRDLSGIQAFTNLDTLYLYLWISEEVSVDLSGNSSLSYLSCSGSENSTPLFLDLSNNTRLQYLYLSDLILDDLDLTGLKELTSLWLTDVGITGLDLSGNLKLLELHLNENSITGLDLSNQPALKVLHCNSNWLTKLDLTGQPALKELGCAHNRLTELELGGNPELSKLNCDGNLLTRLDLSGNPLLGTGWYCVFLFDRCVSLCEMPTLYEVCISPDADFEAETDGSPHLFLTTECSTDTVPFSDPHLLDALFMNGVDANGDSLIQRSEARLTTRLDLSGYGISDLGGLEEFCMLDTLDLSSNHLASIDLTGLDSLVWLDCSDNPITRLDLTRNASLGYLDISEDPGLWEIQVGSLPYPPDSVMLLRTGSPNVYFTLLSEEDGDALEENDLLEEAVTVVVNQPYDDLFVSVIDDDWYRIRLQQCFQVEQTLMVDFGALNAGDKLNAELLDEQGILVASAVIDSASSRIAASVDPGGEYFLLTSISSGMASYRLQLHLPDYPSFYFLPDTVWIMDAVTYELYENDLELMNNGDLALIIDSVTTDLEGSRVVPAFGTVQNGEKTAFRVEMYPRETGPVTGTLTFHISDPVNQDFEVMIAGKTTWNDRYTFLREFNDTLVTGNLVAHLLNVGNPSETNWLNVIPQIVTYDLPSKGHDLIPAPQEEQRTWITTSLPQESHVPPGGSLVMAFAVDAKGIPAGDFFAEIQLHMYNPLHLIGLIPVRMHVHYPLGNKGPGGGPVQEDDTGLKLFPNPAGNFLRVETDVPGRKNIEVSTVEGALMFSIVMEGASMEIDLASLPGGIYLITLRSQGRVATGKFVRQ